VVRPLLGIPDNEIIICGKALGHNDPEAPVNALVTSAPRSAILRHSTAGNHSELLLQSRDCRAIVWPLG
jgi:hypothetical protein